MIDFDAIAGTEATRDPFQFFATPGVLNTEDLAAIRADFPDIRKPGIFPLSELTYGPAFARLIEDIRSQELEDILAEKYGVDLSGKPLMITVRGHAQKKDGRIHTDTKTKFVTCLLYLNDPWDAGGGRLRMLRTPDDIGDFIAEIPPNGGTLASFVRSDNSWHGHEPYTGERRYVMFNWVTSQVALDRELGRHRFSAKIKQFNPFT
ncbi:MAG: 2OG-Fe(II) oxygenase [Alphaproteobacteria bacterium]